MHTIVLATQKGGAGKSTLAIGLARAAIDTGHIVRLVETDQQGTLTSWKARRGHAEPRVDPVYAAGDIAGRLDSLAREGVTIAIVDTAGGVGIATSTAIRNADLCLIPARPNVADIEATAVTVAEVRRAGTPFAFVLNQTPLRGQRIAGAADALGVTALDIPDAVAQPFIVMRTDHQDALSAGLAVSEYAPSGKSAEEIRGLWSWVEARLGIAAAVMPEDVGDLPIAPMPVVQPSPQALHFA
ncbi:MAG: ParA family protein [Bradyrhizobium sp.]|nr:ParA family protein [Bradyrhizobium sp.]